MDTFSHVAKMKKKIPLAITSSNKMINLWCLKIKMSKPIFEVGGIPDDLSKVISLMVVSIKSHFQASSHRRSQVPYKVFYHVYIKQEILNIKICQ